jgi:hypothetical protein
MEWLQTIIKSSLTGKIEEAELEGVATALETSINKEMPLRYIPKDVYNSKANELKVTTEKMEGLQAQIETATASQGDAEALKESLTKITDEFNTFKEETVARQGESVKIGSLEKALRLSGAAEDAIDLLTKEFTLSEITLDSKDNIVDWDIHEKAVKAKRKSMFTVTQTNSGGGDGGTPEPTGDESVEAAFKRMNLKGL